MEEQRKLPTQKPKEERCKVTIKKKRDGSIVKEVSGSCTKLQLRALQGNEDSDFDD
jgi:hypothetical protein